MEYEQMLDSIYENLPESQLDKERFEIPKVVGHIQGSKTVISNFLQICSVLHRRPEHIIKFVLKELATPGDLRGSLFILGAKVSASKINEKISLYSKIFVQCSECGKPDTKLNKKGNIIFLDCSACGAKHPVPHVR